MGIWESRGEKYYARSDGTKHWENSSENKTSSLGGRAFGGHLWYGLFLQDLGGHGPLDPPPDLLPLVNPRDTPRSNFFLFNAVFGKELAK